MQKESHERWEKYSTEDLIEMLDRLIKGFSSEQRIRVQNCLEICETINWRREQ